MLPKKACERERNAENYQLYRERDQMIAKFEIIIKFFNDVVAVNRAMKLQINALRKERTMYGSIFKDLENQIKNEECRLLESLETARNAETELKENTDYLRKMHQVLDKNRSNSINELKVEQESHFKQLQDRKSSRRSIEVRGLAPKKSMQPENESYVRQQSILRKFVANARNKVKSNRQSCILDTIQIYQRMEKEKKIADVENLLRDIKIRSEESDLLVLIDSFHSVKEQNERLFQEYNELEKEVG
jgi:hypothetical protein